MDYLWLKLSWRDPQCIWRHLPFGLSPTLTFEFKMPFISVFGLALVFRGGGPGFRRLVSRRKARRMCYPLWGTGTCGAALPLPESLSGWVRLSPPPALAGVLELQEPRKLHGGVGWEQIPKRLPGPCYPSQPWAPGPLALQAPPNPAPPRPAPPWVRGPLALQAPPAPRAHPTQRASGCWGRPLQRWPRSGSDEEDREAGCRRSAARGNL